MGPDGVVQLDNITPTGPTNGKYFIPGIPGSAFGCSCTKWWPGEARGHFDALRRRGLRHAALKFLNGCSTERRAEGWRVPNRRGLTALQVLTNMLDAFGTTRGTQKFPFAASVRVSLSSVRSDTTLA
jgi:hypothetical protein